MRKIRTSHLIAVLVGLGVPLLARAVAPIVIESRLNRVVRRPPYTASAAARKLHSQLTIVDLHADSLLWGRNLLERSARGHVDLPRMAEGNVAIQFFTVVTKSPRGLNVVRNDDKTDMVTSLAVAGGWPRKTWGSLKDRALYQAGRLHTMAAASHGGLTVLHTSGDLDEFLRRRNRDPHIAAAVLGLEGAHALEGDLDNLEQFYSAGFRMAAPTHFFDTDISGSSSGVRQAGLSAKGHEFVGRMESLHMLIDLAHASPRTIDEVTAIATRPVVVSHTGVRATCDNPRNLSDRQLRAVANTGGVIGIGYWQTAVCGTDANAIARAIRHCANVAGVDHTAIGSDFDGAVTTPFDTTGIVQLTDALLNEGFSSQEIEKIMGGNTLRILLQVLPKQQ